MKRRRGPYYRYQPYNIHRKKVISKDTKTKAREEDHLKLLNVFVVIRYNYRRIILYIVPNGIRKITAEAILSTFLTFLVDESALFICEFAYQTNNKQRD
jgi:hypothetical protein